MSPKTASLFSVFSALSLLLAFASGGTSCSTLEVHSDHDPSADFARFKTFAWSPDADRVAAPDATGVPSDIFDDRIRAAIEAHLEAKGLRPSGASEKPDVYVRYSVVHQPKVQASGIDYSVGVGYGFAPWYGTYGGPVFPDVRQYTEGTIVIDLIDAETERLVWRGIASEIQDEPSPDAQTVDEMVAETFKQYPPPPKG